MTWALTNFLGWGSHRRISAEIDGELGTARSPGLVDGNVQIATRYLWR
jgi:hypothetical protein